MSKRSLLMMLLMALVVPWAAQAQEELTVHDGTATNNFVPFYGYYADAYNKCEMVYPATELSSMADGTITSMTFYATQSSVSWGCNFQVFVAEVDETTISAFAGPGTVVYEGVLAISGNQMVVDFATPYVYNGGNLLVGVYNTTKGNYITSSWYGENVNGASISGYSYNGLDGVSATGRNFLPKTTFGYLPAGVVFVAPPSNLNVSLTPGNGSVATLAWTENGTATQWQICLNDDETNLVTATTNPYTFTDLTAETAYTAKVRATTADGESAWSNEVTFTPTDAYSLTVNDGTSTNNYVPIFGLYVDELTRSQFIIPSSDLAAMAYGTINKMTFYSSNASVNWGSAQFEVYMTETEETTLSALADWSGMEKVMNAASLSISGNQMVVTLDAPYQYMGGNLLIGFYQTVTGSYSSCSWFGVSATGASQGGSSTNGSYAPVQQQDFLPKTTFDYIPGEAPTCLRPSAPDFARITFNSADVAWTPAGTETQWQLCINDDETNLILVSNPMYSMTGLTPETEYSVKVRAYCSDDDQSAWSANASFTTLVACPAPTDMVISDITAFSANVAWTGDNENIEFRYAIDNAPVADFDDSSLQGWTNIDADADGYVWMIATESAGVYHNEGVDPSGLGHNNSQDFIVSGSWSNSAGIALFPDNYLVSPQITLGGSISFWAQAQDVNFAAEHFGVAVSTTGNTDAADFTTIQEWTMTAKSAGTLRSNNSKRGGNRATGNWYQYTVDLSAYSGQGYVAIRHFDCTDQFMLNVDDIAITAPNTYDWVYVTNPTNPQALTNLQDETKYIVQVRANCDNGYNSEWLEGTFTTLPSCMVPTNLVISNIDKRSADLAWTANGEEETWQICLNGDETNLITVNTTSYSFTGLTPETMYNVKVRAYCDEDDQSAWSSPAVFTTLVACPAPTALAISDITNVSAVATWTYDGDVEFEYAEDVWRHYDNGVYPGSGGIGTGGSDVYWAIMLPPTMLPTEPLTTVSLFEATGYSEEPITLMIYSGGDTAPDTLLYQEEVTPLAADDFHEITLAEPVTFDATQNLWIVCKEYGTFPAIGCNYLGDPNGRWISLDGIVWEDVANYVNYTWMIRAAFGNNTQAEWVAVNDPASPQTIAGLTPETNYLVRLRAVCGGEDGESVWVTTSFTTDVACPAPTALGATPYALSAELSWEGSSESYTVSYRTAAGIQANLSEGFEGTTFAPEGWNTINVSGSSTWQRNTSYKNSGTASAYVNWASSGHENYLISPAYTPGTGEQLSFYVSSQTWAGTTLTVEVSTTTAEASAFTQTLATYTTGYSGTIGSTDPSTFVQKTLDLSAYAGQQIYIAFHVVDNNGSGIYLDDFVIGAEVPAGDWMTVTAEEAAATLTGLTPETKYEWKVQGDCGDFGMSKESAIMSFTTTNDLCPMPTNLTVNAETLTATTADLSWNGSPDVESFTVRYRVPEHVVGGISESFDANSVPAGWTRYSGLVNDVIDGTATLTTTTSGWNTTTYALGTYNMKVNIYGSSVKYWLVSPEVTPTNGNFTFDLALTAYSGSGAASGTCDDDRFVVLVSTDDEATWTILREWNNTGSEYVYNTIATAGENVSIDLSAYVGQTVKIAFYGESTVSGNGDNDLHIDNVVIGNPQTIPATDWMTVENITDMNVTLTGLTPETPYEAQVKSDCSDPEAWSNTVTFTTLEQTTVTQTIALAEGTNWVSFYVDITLGDLQAALVEAVTVTNPTITIKSQSQNVRYQLGRWFGQLASLNMSKMYKITVPEDCEISLEGMPIDPTELSVEINPNGSSWIAFPFNESMTVADFFGTFPINLDQVKSQNQNVRYQLGRWFGALTTLVPGQGYIYNSTSSETRTFNFPTGTSKVDSKAPQMPTTVAPTLLRKDVKKVSNGLVKTKNPNEFKKLNK